MCRKITDFAFPSCGATLLLLLTVLFGAPQFQSVEPMAKEPKPVPSKITEATEEDWQDFFAEQENLDYLREFDR